MSENDTNAEVSYDAWMRRNPPHPGSHIYHGCMEAVEACARVWAWARRPASWACPGWRCLAC